MKMIDGIAYFRPSDVGAVLGVCAQTVVSWDRYRELMAREGITNTGIPTPRLVGNQRHYTAEDIRQLQAWRANLQRGTMGDYWLTRMGKLGKDMKRKRLMREWENL